MINSLLFSSLYLANPNARLLLPMLCTSYKHDQTNVFFNISIPFNVGEQLINIPSYHQDLAQLPTPLTRKSKFLAVTDSPLNVDDRIAPFYFDVSFAFNLRKMQAAVQQQNMVGLLRTAALLQIKTKLPMLPINYYFGYFIRFSKKKKALNTFTYNLKLSKQYSRLSFVHFKRGAFFHKLRKVIPIFTDFFHSKHVYKHFGHYGLYKYLFKINKIFRSRALRQTRPLLEKKLAKAVAPFMYKYLVYGLRTQLQINVPITYHNIVSSVLPLLNYLGNPITINLFGDRLDIKPHPIFPLKIRALRNSFRQKLRHRRIHFFSRYISRLSIHELGFYAKYFLPLPKIFKPSNRLTPLRSTLLNTLLPKLKLNERKLITCSRVSTAYVPKSVTYLGRQWLRDYLKEKRSFNQPGPKVAETITKKSHQLGRQWLEEYMRECHNA